MSFGTQRRQIHWLIHSKNQESRVIFKSWLIYSEICLKTNDGPIYNAPSTHYGGLHKVLLILFSGPPRRQIHRLIYTKKLRKSHNPKSS